MKTLVLASTLLLLAGAARADEEPPVETVRDACSLLTEDEVAAVQGEAFTKTNLARMEAKSLCFYELPSFERSISLDVMRDGAAAYWLENFGEPARAKRAAARLGKRKKDGPKPVAGVGREAFWAGNRTGSLYVFTGDAILRISVGGGGTEAEKIERTKTLALAALERM